MEFEHKKMVGSDTIELNSLKELIAFIENTGNGRTARIFKWAPYTTLPAIWTIEFE